RSLRFDCRARGCYSGCTNLGGNTRMKLVTGLAAVLVLLAVACGGDDDDADTSTVVIPAADADRVAHEALITVEALPGDGWQVVEEDVFGDDSDGDDFLAMLEGTPECETLENLSTLGSL